jgi:hypothetical protein
MSANQAENALSDTRLEWVEEATPGEFPADPEWNAFSPEEVEFTYSSDGNKEARDVTGQIDAFDHDRANETASPTLNYRQARFPVDGSGNVLDPIAYPITVDEAEDYPSHTLVRRQNVTSGGKTGAGFREFAVVRGARPVSATFDGDPSASEPIPQELGYEAERARTHIVHQPDSDTSIVVKSTDDSDSVDVTIEDEDAATAETVTLPGSSPNTVATTATFGDIDAVEVEGDHAGDIQIGTDDGSGSIDTELLEKPLTGSNTDGVDSVLGVPALGSGSHASSISETGPLFLGTDATWTGSALSDRVHALELSVEREVDRNAQQTTRRQTIDVGGRTVSFDADLAGPYESAERIAEHHRDKSGDFIYTFETGETITAANATIVDAPDFTRSAGDTNFIPKVSFEASGDPAITISKS